MKYITLLLQEPFSELKPYDISKLNEYHDLWFNLYRVQSACILISCIGIICIYFCVHFLHVLFLYTVSYDLSYTVERATQVRQVNLQYVFNSMQTCYNSRNSGISLLLILFEKEKHL